MKRLLVKGLVLVSFMLGAPWGAQAGHLVKFKNTEGLTSFANEFRARGYTVKEFSFGPWLEVHRPEGQKVVDHSKIVNLIKKNPHVLYVQPDYPVKLINNFKVTDPELRKKLGPLANSWAPHTLKADNPPLPTLGRDGVGADPLYHNQWGMKDIGLMAAWEMAKKNWRAPLKNSSMVVAVLDTGVDYTHEDLNHNLWRNPGEMGLDDQGREKSNNGVDDDNNGHIDDVIGWDFASDDNLPYDLTLGLMDIILKGGNPGHGTHCAGNVGASSSNGKGIAGVAPNAKIMVLRFLTEKGQGTSANAIRSIEYAVKNGAQILSNSWGSVGEDPKEEETNKALREAILFSENQGTLFVAAAGNGKAGKGYDNDSDEKPAYPSSYPMENIISVAAIDEAGNLGSFSNWGATTVDLAAPGVKVFSTIPGGLYKDTVIDFLGIKVTWDGTSMATPHVAGALALYWSLHPEKDWREVKEDLMNSVVKTSVLEGKVLTGGKLSALELIEVEQK